VSAPSPAPVKAVQKAEQPETVSAAEQRGNLWSIGIHPQNELRIFAQGKKREDIRTDRALLELEDEQTVLTLKDRRLVFTVAARSNPQTTEAASLVSVALDAGQVVLTFGDGTKETYTTGTIKVDPRLDTVRIRHFAGEGGPSIDRQYRR